MNRFSPARCSCRIERRRASAYSCWRWQYRGFCTAASIGPRSPSCTPSTASAASSPLQRSFRSTQGRSIGTRSPGTTGEGCVSKGWRGKYGSRLRGSWKSSYPYGYWRNTSRRDPKPQDYRFEECSGSEGERNGWCRLRGRLSVFRAGRLLCVIGAMPPRKCADNIGESEL